MAGIELVGISRRFGDGPPAVDDVSLEVADGESLVLAGPSGSGKTTLLRIIAGLEVPDRGRVLIGGDDVTRLRPAGRNVSMVFLLLPLSH